MAPQLLVDPDCGLECRPAWVGRSAGRQGEPAERRGSPGSGGWLLEFGDDVMRPRAVSAVISGERVLRRAEPDVSCRSQVSSPVLGELDAYQRFVRSSPRAGAGEGR